ncbi:HEPN domain-containing protein [Stenotrophomonas sp. JAI102]|uniref:ApeA N-terminal domain 1-containing protein n=1 Tax=Stenotrophomonas sp. JAI102 TaxID=2723077 RepID=UPI0015C7F007|nr:HEPN domain-containing protein [Stenotrophomonas sp. JAI102]NYF34480.1 hypothetical protein [Stenotrophomonas sp. JAI102]
MKINPDLLIEQEWACTLFPADHPELAFPGVLKHSPTSGLTLQFATPIDARYDEDYHHLHGYTSAGVAITLVGNFSTKTAGLNLRSGMAYHTSKGHPFQFAIFGHHFAADSAFIEYTFDIAGADAFFARSGSIALIPFGSEPLFRALSGSCEFSGRFTGTFNSLPPRLSDYILGNDDDAMAELQAAYTTIREKHQDFRPLIKKSAKFAFKLSIPDGADVMSAQRNCQAVADLFAILFFGPAKLSRLTATVKDEKGFPHEFDVFPWRLSEAGSLQRAADDKSYLHLPLNNLDVNFGELLSKWMQISDKFSTTLSIVQSSTTLISESEVLSRIVLNVAQLEGMAHEAGKHENQKKYQYGIDTYSSPFLSNFLKSLLRREASDLGKAISDLRNDIAHMGRPRTYLDKMSFRDKYAACLALEAVIIGYVLDQLGASKTSVEKYQKTLISMIQRKD